MIGTERSQLSWCVSWCSICAFASSKYKATTAAQSLLEAKLMTTHNSCLPPGRPFFTTDTHKRHDKHSDHWDRSADSLTNACSQKRMLVDECACTEYRKIQGGYRVQTAALNSAHTTEWKRVSRSDLRTLSLSQQSIQLLCTGSSTLLIVMLLMLSLMMRLLLRKITDIAPCLRHSL